MTNDFSDFDCDLIGSWGLGAYKKCKDGLQCNRLSCEKTANCKDKSDVDPEFCKGLEIWYIF